LGFSKDTLVKDTLELISLHQFSTDVEMYLPPHNIATTQLLSATTNHTSTMSSPSARKRGNKAAASSTPTKRRSSPSKAAATTSNAPNRKTPRTPPRQSASSSKVVTPALTASLPVEGKKKKSAASNKKSTAKSARRSLNLNDTTTKRDDTQKKLPFGLNKKAIEIPPNVQRVYHIVHKHSGSLGGNGHGGAIYGELTTGSMQKMTNLMIEHTGLSKSSRFIDVGCGLGKPNLHVAQFPGVDFSYGIEMEHVRWMIGMSNLEHVLKSAKDDVNKGVVNDTESKIGHGCYLSHGDITEANFFDPFTHVYMFDIGFPPRLFHQLAEMFNNSQSEYLICYHAPRLMIDDYGFNIELIHQTPTSMHGSAEGHQGYIYRRDMNVKSNARKACKTKTFGVPCDPLFSTAWKMCRGGLDPLLKYTSDEVQKQWGGSNKRVTRASRRKSSGEEEEKKTE